MSWIRRIFTGTGKGGTVYSVDKLSLRTTGMRSASEYRVGTKDGKAEVSFLEGAWDDGDDREPAKTVLCREDRVLKLMNDCRLLSWDGFRGKHPKGVRDGTMFTLEAIVNDGKTVKAQGSQNFPRHYRKFTDGLREILNDPGTDDPREVLNDPETDDQREELNDPDKGVMQ